MWGLQSFILTLWAAIKKYKNHARLEDVTGSEITGSPHLETVSFSMATMTLMA